MEIKSQPVYYVVFFITKYASLQEAKQKASEEMTAHLVRSNNSMNKESSCFLELFLTTLKNQSVQWQFLHPMKQPTNMLKATRFYYKAW